MVDAFELEIIKRSGSQKLSVMWVEIESPTGDFVVGPNHAPLVSLLKDRGKLTYKEISGPEKTIDVYGGIFKVSDNHAIALLD
jgi:F0F1-type ATP synthase epsilon subunit